MQIDTPRQYFDQLAKQGKSPHLVNAIGTCEFDIEGAGTWRVEFNRGNLSVAEKQPADRSQAGAYLHMTKADFVRLARGEGHENGITALLRGALKVEGDIRIAQYVQAILPVPAEWESAS